MPNSSPVHGEPALGGVGAWAPPDVGEGMDLDPVTDMAGTGDGALTGVVGLGSGQVRQVGGVSGALPKGVGVASSSVPVASARSHPRDEVLDLGLDSAMPGDTANSCREEGAGRDGAAPAARTKGRYRSKRAGRHGQGKK